MSYLDSPLYQQMLARTLAQGQPQSQYPTQAIGNTLAQLLNVWQMKKSVDAQDAKTKAGNDALANLLAPENYSGPSTGGGPSQTFALSGGGSVDMATPSIPSDVNANKRAQIAQLLTSGVITPDAIAPQVLRGLGLGEKAPVKLGKDESLLDPTDFHVLAQGPSDPQFGQTPQFDQQGRAYVLDKSGNVKFLDGIKDRPKVDVSNGTAYDPYNTAPGTTFAPQPEAPMSPERYKQEGNLAYTRAAASASQATDTYSEPKMVEIDDGKGGTKQVLAQQNKQTGQWATADASRAPLAAVSLPGGAGGIRSQVMLGRVLSSGHTVANELENLSALPAGATTGWFGTPENGGTVTSAIKANLTRAVQPQEVQSAQVAMAGLSRALAQMEASGLAPGGALTSQMGKLELQAGDTENTRLQKLATMRQTAEGILDSMANQPAASTAQVKEIAGLKDRISKAIPFLPIDVINLAKAKNPKATIGEMAKQRGLGKPADPATDALLKKYGIQ